MSADIAGLNKRVFAEGNPFWSRHSDQNLDFLRCVQNHAQDMLAADGFLPLNDVYRALGIKRTEEGALAGWVESEGTYVDFGLDRNEFNISVDSKPVELVFNTNSANVFADSAEISDK